MKRFGKKAHKIVKKTGEIWKKSKLNSEKDMEIMEETQVEYKKDLEKYGSKTSRIVKR